jgi:hypothetical protein
MDGASSRRRNGGGLPSMASSVKGGQGRFLFYTPALGAMTAPSFEEIGLDSAIQEGNQKSCNSPKSGTTRRVSGTLLAATAAMSDRLPDRHTLPNTSSKEGGHTEHGRENTPETQKTADRFANLLCEGPFWLDVTAPTDTEMRTLSKVSNVYREQAQRVNIDAT